MNRALCLLFALSLAPTLLVAQSKVDQAVQKAEEQLAKGKPEDAVKTMSKLVEQNPTSAEAYIAMASLQQRLGNFDEAAAVLAKAKDAVSGAGKAEVLGAIASLNLAAGRTRLGTRSRRPSWRQVRPPSPPWPGPRSGCRMPPPPS